MLRYTIKLILFGAVLIYFIKLDENQIITEDNEIIYISRNTNKYNNERIISLSNKVIIPIAFSLNNSYISQTIVAMTSICVNAYNNTYYELYLLFLGNINSYELEKLFSVKERNQKSCNVTIINSMNMLPNEIRLDYRILTPNYYKLNMPSIFRQYDKMIFLDSDIIALDDLSEMYNLEIKKNYFLGYMSDKLDDLKLFNITNSKLYICGGVLLMNLKKMREDKLEYKIKELINNHKDKLVWDEQTVINVVCSGKIGLLPPKYGIFNYLCYDEIMESLRFYNEENVDGRYNKEEVIEAFLSPKLIHYIKNPKPWNVSYKGAHFHDFWYYAEKSVVYSELLNNFREQEKEKRKKNKK